MRSILVLALLLGSELQAAVRLEDALSARKAGNYEVAIEILVRLVAESPGLRHELLLAETLAWDKRFADAETVYRKLLSQHSDSAEGELGLARVVMWQGRYEEAKRRLVRILLRNESDLAALEDLAFARYWSGDYRSAARDFESVLRARPDRADARNGLAAIRSGSSPGYQTSIHYLSDDQPFRVLRSEVRATAFSDPLTKWEGRVGSYNLDDPVERRRLDVPYVHARGEVGLPDRKLTISGWAGLLDYPDSSIRGVGGIAIRRAMPASSALTVQLERQELVATATSLDSHPFSDNLTVQWERESETGWSAAAQAGRRRYFDDNSGSSASLYLLMPLRAGAVSLWAGGAIAAADTDEGRFTAQRVSGERISANTFRYRFEGAYDPYWTPHDLREARFIMLTRGQLGGKVRYKVQADVGFAKDQAVAFGPDLGVAPLPSPAISFFFERTYHPWRFEVSASLPLTTRLSLEASYRHDSSASYQSNDFHASLVGRF
ncbi:MAG TPA: tetratricopeptide repeat protein [Thermoanaerobaculia bacterium]|nr:tetratricopeptide repeat protein [Thermoanaerobaculia bacterium]